MTYLEDKLINFIEHQNDSRPDWNSTRQFVLDYLVEESFEADEGREMVILGADPSEYAYEVADVVIFGVEAVRLGNPTQIPLTVINRYYTILEEALEVGIDLNAVVRDKAVRNEHKYNRAIMELSDDPRNEAKNHWKLMRGEEMFAVALMEGADYE